jgi:hypothetical protein
VRVATPFEVVRSELGRVGAEIFDSIRFGIMTAVDVYSDEVITGFVNVSAMSSKAYDPRKFVSITPVLWHAEHESVGTLEKFRSILHLRLVPVEWGMGDAVQVLKITFGNSRKQ